MKKILILISCIALLSSCYEDYVKDYDYDAVYFAYQYDMRTIVADEIPHFNITAALAGVINNSRDRAVDIVIDDDLVTADLSSLAPEGVEVSPFKAYDVFSAGAPMFGTLYQTDVVSTFKKSGVREIAPLPQSYYTVSGLNDLAIKKGRNTAAFTITATEEMLSDDSVVKPVYAIGARMLSADADKIPQGKDFTIIAVRVENKYFGNWYHGGAYVVKDKDGNVVKEESYPFSIPQLDNKNYALTTMTINSVQTNKYIQNKGSLLLTFNGDDITISSSSLKLVDDGRKSHSNGATLIQDRELYLNYTFENADGGVTEVSDTLYFRNRIRDGANEWQDENPEHYR